MLNEAENMTIDIAITKDWIFKPTWLPKQVININQLI